MLIVLKYIVPRGYLGIVVFPFIFIKDPKLRSNMVFINHERIHLRQQIELLVIPFYVLYCVEFIVRLVQYRNWRNAYLAISFEKEAYFNEKNLDYIESRSFYGFKDYF